MSAGAHHRTLTAHMSDWSADRVAALLRRRPDLAERPLENLADLAKLAQLDNSLRAAIGRTTLAENRLLQLVVCSRQSIPLEEFPRLLPDGVTMHDIEPVLASLEEAALVWRFDGRLHTSGAIRQLMPTRYGPPLGALLNEQNVEYLKSAIESIRGSLAKTRLAVALPARATGPVGRQPRKADLVDEIERLVATDGLVAGILDVAPPAAAELARDLADGHPATEWQYYWSYSSHGRRDDPAWWLYTHAMVLPVPHAGYAVQPREVGVALHGGKPIADLALQRPATATGTVDQRTVDADGASAVARTVDLLADLLDWWDEMPAKGLRSGGLGVATTKQVASKLDVAPDTTELLVEIAYATGLIRAKTESRMERRNWVSDTQVHPTEAASRWLALPEAERSSQLAAAWLAADYWPSAAGRQPDGAKAKPLLTSPHSHGAARHRAAVLDELARLDIGQRTTEDQLDAAVYWDRPQRWLGDRYDSPPRSAIRWIWAEAELLGIVAHGSLTTFGRATVRGRREDAATSLAAVMPEPVTTFTLQADLTATIVGTPPRDLMVELRLIADVESIGHATTARFSESSLRRALDAGRTAQQILAFLDARAAKGVPQPLTYLVHDVARRHGHLRVRAAETIVTSDDPGVLADACTTRKTRRLGLTLLAPTVAVSQKPVQAVLDGLRDAGFLPTLDDATGGAAAKAPTDGSEPIALTKGTAPEVGAGPPLSGPFNAGRRARAARDSDYRGLAEHIVAGVPPPTTQFGSRSGRGPLPTPLDLEFDDGDDADDDDDDFGFGVDVDFDEFDDDIDEFLGADDAHADMREELNALIDEALGERVLAVSLDDATDPLVFVPTGTGPGLVVGIDVIDHRDVSFAPADVLAIVDLGPYRDFTAPATRPARKPRGRRR